MLHIISYCMILSFATASGITLDLVEVGDAGNSADTTGFGAVDYSFSIGKYEATNGQYVAFLNAKALSDPLGLYQVSMNITRSGADGSYTYTTAAANQPITSVSFWNAARFANWLHNGQGNGNTESGAYTLTPAAISTNSVTRNPGARWAIASEDEWYKAAHYDAANESYYTYATASNSRPSYATPSAGSNLVNHWPFDFSITTELQAVGSYPGSLSPYGTADQNGNVWEWNETIFEADRGVRGGSYQDGYTVLRNTARNQNSVDGTSLIGFRVVQVPEPHAVAGLLGLAALLAAGIHRRRSAGR